MNPMLRRASLLSLFMLTAIAAPAQTAEGPAEPWAEVTVYRDSWGVPHVVGESLESLGFGFGYAQGEDHLEEMLLAYRAATGRSAAILGEPYDVQDVHVLRLGIPDLAEQAWADADPQTRALCRGFAKGVNAAIRDPYIETPDWAEPIKPADILALMQTYLIGFAPFDLPGLQKPPPPAVSGSAWAVAPERSESGSTLLFIGAQERYDGFYRWYEAHLVGSDLNIYGATLYGLPVLLQAHNETLGWGLTPNRADFADVYVEPLPGRAGRPGQMNRPRLDKRRLLYLASRSQPRSYQILTSQGLEDRSTDYVPTEYGPIIGEYEGHPASLHCPALNDFGATSQFLAMARAQDFGEFADALRMQSLPCFHLVYGDRDGNVFYRYNTMVGEREVLQTVSDEDGEQEAKRVPINWSLPLDRRNPRYRWGSIIPPDDLPGILNPESGYVQACGNAPWGAAPRSDLKAKDWLQLNARDVDSFRSKRVRHRLSWGPHNFAATQSLAYDTQVSFALFAVPKLEEFAAPREDGSPVLGELGQQALDLLLEWGKTANATEPGMTLFATWMEAYTQLLLDETGQAPPLADFFLSDAVDPNQALRALENAAAQLDAAYGTIAVAWGNVHQFHRGERSIEADGGGPQDSLLVLAGVPGPDGDRPVSYGAGFSMAVRFGETVEAQSIVPFGAAERPDSPHFDDQMDRFLAKGFKNTVFSLRQVKNGTHAAFGSHLIFQPLGTEATLILDAETPILARVEAATSSPVALPAQMRPLTRFMVPEVNTGDNVPAAYVEVRIPPSAADDTLFQRAALYQYYPDTGWLVMNGTSDLATRLITASDDFMATVYVVLAPSPPGAVPRAEPSEVPDDSEPENTGSQPEAEKAAAFSDTDLAENPPNANSAQTSIAWGRIAEVHLPGESGLVTVAADEVIGARAVLSQGGGDPLPPGLARFSPTVEVECSDPGQVTLVDILLRVPEDACVPGRMDELAVFTYDAEAGWRILEETMYSAALQAFTGRDATPGTYAVLGPAECVPTQSGE